MDILIQFFLSLDYNSDLIYTKKQKSEWVKNHKKIFKKNIYQTLKLAQSGFEHLYKKVPSSFT